MEKKICVIAEFSIFPVGQPSTSLGKYVAKAISAIKKIEGLNIKVTPMGTILEAKNLDIIFKAVKTAHETIFSMGILRIESNLKIDDRKDKPRNMHDKLKTINKHLI